MYTTIEKRQKQWLFESVSVEEDGPKIKIAVERRSQSYWWSLHVLLALERTTNGECTINVWVFKHFTAKYM